jgi:LAO/AO transport system kinase
MEKDLIERIIAGDVRAAARLMRGIDDDLPEATRELEKLYKYTGKAFILGITGAPGVGKSTLVDALVTGFRKRQMTVGVVAIDPTSPFTGGALLGDRIRMGKHSTDSGVFIRSLGSRGWSGGLSRTTGNIIHVMDAMGKEVIIVEAVGSGQGELDISRIADTALVVLSPGAGDEIQMMKAGILETADVFIINKADKDGATNLKVNLEVMLGMQAETSGKWKPEIVLTEAVSGKGIDDAVEMILKHKAHLVASGEISQRRRNRAKMELSEAIEYALRLRMNKILDETYFKELSDKLAERKVNPYSTAEEVVTRVLSQPDMKPAHRK